MKGAEQLARSCRRLGREGVGARRAGTRTRTRAARAPRCKPRDAAPLPAPLPADPRLPHWLRGARSAEPPPRERGASRLPRLSPFCFCFCFLFFEAPRPPFWGGLPVATPSPAFLCVLYLGMCLAIVVVCVINCTRAFPCSLRERGLNWL